MKREYKHLLAASLKSRDTEEWLDVYVTRPIGLVVALAGRRLGLHPNVITVVSMVLGVAAGYMFYHTDLWHNVAGVALLFAANICDSADGQLARLTDRKTLLGRVLDGVAGDIVFFFVYLGMCLRLFFQPMPGMSVPWHMWVFVLAYLAGFMSHIPQASLSDYYRQIHLHMLRGDGGELCTSDEQRRVYEQTPRRRWLVRLFFLNYTAYCRNQERRSPRFQLLRRAMADSPLSAEAAASLRREFLAGSRPLMKYTNFLTFNSRALLIYATCLLGCPYVYFVIEVVVYNIVYVYMHRSHESMCAALHAKYFGDD